MVQAIVGVETLTDDFPVFDDYGPDHRAWTRESRSLLSELQRPADIGYVVHVMTRRNR